MAEDIHIRNTDWLGEFFGADELDPELAEYLSENERGWTSIKHPLVFSMFHIPMMNRQCNAMLIQKRQVLAEYRAEHNWKGVILAHERPYRIDALLELAADVTDREWWELVAFVWTDSENIREFPDAWEFILRADRAHRHCMMNDFERQAYERLPEVIAVYQGCTDERDDGWSWTTQRKTAEWFARRFADMEDAIPMVRAGFVDKADVTAYFTRRNEAEILVAPEFVREL